VLFRSLYEALAAFVQDHNREKKNRRIRWTLALVGFFAYMTFNVYWAIHSGEVLPTSSNYAAVVRIDGPIQMGKSASTKVLFPVLEKAFGDDKAKCVALAINSPGGMVGQSEMIYEQIRKLAKKNNKKVIAVGEDLMASGGYFIASAAERIYAPKMSAVGSVGVRQDSYDLTGIAEKLGIKDRTLTAGKMKDSNNPLKPLSEEARAKATHDLETIHTEFKRVVRESRGDRIKLQDDEIFTGEVFTGIDGFQLGLTDGFLDLEDAVKADCGADGIKVIAPSLGFSDLLGMVSGW
jgi:protease-4